MRQLTISIEDNRYWQFLQFIRTLDYIKVQDNLTESKVISEQPMPQPTKNFFANLQTLPIAVDNLIVDRAEIYDEH